MHTQYRDKPTAISTCGLWFLTSVHNTSFLTEIQRTHEQYKHLLLQWVCVCVCVRIFYFVIVHLPVQTSAFYAMALCALEFSIIGFKPLQVHQVSVKHLCFISGYHHCHLHHQPAAQQSSGCMQELEKIITRTRMTVYL